jgi:hypothetical protein
MDAGGTNMTQDQDHLRTLSVFHYVVGVMAGLVALFPIAHLAIISTIVLLEKRAAAPNGSTSNVYIWIILGITAAFVVFAGLMVLAVFLAGRFLSKRRHYTYCFAMACLECFFLPFGTVLGVFTIIVLARESVRKLFGVPGAT